jgi:hypothetical protein
MSAEPLTPEDEARYRAMLIEEQARAHMDRASLLRAAEGFRAALDALRASLDPDRPEAVEAWAAVVHSIGCDYPTGGQGRCPYWDAHRQRVAALLHAQAKAERP